MGVLPDNDDDIGADQPMDHHSHRVGGRRARGSENDDDESAAAPPGTNTTAIAVAAVAIPPPTTTNSTKGVVTHNPTGMNESIIGKKKNATSLIDDPDDDEHSLIGDTPNTKESLHMNRSTTEDMKLKQRFKMERDQALEQQQQQQQQQQLKEGDEESKTVDTSDNKTHATTTGTKDKDTTSHDPSITEDMKLKQVLKEEKEHLEQQQESQKYDATNEAQTQEDPAYRKRNQEEREDKSSWQPATANDDDVATKKKILQQSASRHQKDDDDDDIIKQKAKQQQRESSNTNNNASVVIASTSARATGVKTEKDIADISMAIGSTSNQQQQRPRISAPGAVHVAGINSTTTATSVTQQQEEEDVEEQSPEVCGLSPSGGVTMHIHNNNGASRPVGDVVTGGGEQPTHHNNNTEPTDTNDYDDYGEDVSSLGDVPSLVDPSVVETVITAITVEDQEKKLEEKEAKMEEQLREKILQEAVEADVLMEADLKALDESTRNIHKSNPGRKWMITLLVVVCVAVAVVAGIAIGLSLDQSNNEDDPDTNTSLSEEVEENLSTIEMVRKRGFVRCGTYDGRYGFGKLNDEGINEGINIDQCRAVAMAVFDDPSRYEPVVITSKNRFPMLGNGSIDVLTNTVTYNMNRDVYESQSKTGFTFSTPYLYSGLAFGGVPEFVDCADELETFYGDCRHLKICAGFGTTHYFMLMDILPGSVVVSSNSPKEQADFLIDGTCNVVAVEPVSLLETLLRDYGYDGPFKAGSKLFSKEPLSLVTRQDDPQWSNLIDFIVNIFYLAEAENITKATAPESFVELFPDDPDLAAIGGSVVAEFGTYADLYLKHLEPIFPRGGVNTIYEAGDDTGLLYSFPFGYLGAKGPDPIENMTLSKIIDRGLVRCGVIPRPGFAELNDEGNWFGFDVEFCHGIAGAVFYGKSELVEFVNVTRDSSYAYNALANGEVDTIAGARVTIQAKYREPTTNKGIAFSPSTFYDNNTWDSFAFATNQEDHQWSDFVYWVISGTIHAEEVGISQSTSAEMPVTSLFGEDLKQMLRDAVNSIGNYGEIYNRTLQDVVSRSGPNMPNANLTGAQQYPLQVA